VHAHKSLSGAKPKELVLAVGKMNLHIKFGKNRKQIRALSWTQT